MGKLKPVWHFFFWGSILPLMSLIGCSEPEPTSVADVCDLSRQPCSWSTNTRNGDGWEVSVTAAEENRRLLITIVGPDRLEQERVITVWEGRSMFLGRYPVPIPRTQDENRAVFSSQFRLPLCTLEPKMEWQLHLESDGQRVPVPFDLIWIQSSP